MKWSTTAAVLLAAAPLAAADLPKPLVTGLKNPESVCLGDDGAIYVTEIGEFDKAGDGQVSVIRDGKATVFAKGLDDPKGIVAYKKAFYVTDKTRVVKIDAAGTVTEFLAADKFPVPPLFLNDIAIEPEQGTLFVSDSGNLKGEQGAVFKIDVKTGKASVIIDSKTLPGLNTPNGLALDGPSKLLLLDFGSGLLHRVNLADHTSEKVAEGFDGGDGLTWNKDGQLFITSWKTGKVFGISSLGEMPVLLSETLESAADSCLDATGKFVLVPDMKAGTLTAFPAMIP